MIKNYIQKLKNITSEKNRRIAFQKVERQKTYQLGKNAPF